MCGMCGTVLVVAYGVLGLSLLHAADPPRMVTIEDAAGVKTDVTDVRGSFPSSAKFYGASDAFSVSTPKRRRVGRGPGGGTPLGQERISVQCFAATNCARCLAFVVATATSLTGAPNDRACAARMTSMSSSFESAVGRPSYRALAHNSADKRRASSVRGM